MNKIKYIWYTTVFIKFKIQVLLFEYISTLQVVTAWKMNEEPISFHKNYSLIERNNKWNLFSMDWMN